MSHYVERKYQSIAQQFLYDNPFCMAMLDMGLGKTVATLTVLNDLLNECKIFKPLIVAPNLVVRHTWPTELRKWAHLKDLSISAIHGTPAKRIAAIAANADIYIVSRDNISWLVTYLSKQFNYDMAVLDESSSFKNNRSKRFRALKHVRPKFKRVIELTGTPIPNGLMDLWAQMFLLDKGERLYKNITTFRETYFHPARNGFGWILDKGAEPIIFDKVKDICLSMKADDWLDLPPRYDIIKEIELDNLSEYKQFRKEKILELPEKEITAFNAGVLYNKLLQYCNGAVYDDEKNYHVIHNAKLDALEEAIEELQGQSVLLFYQFQSDLDRIKKRFKQAVQLQSEKQIDDWEAGKIRVLVAHAAKAGHGLNLQYGGRFVFWYGISANMELYWQAVKRLHRQGQKYPVMNVHFTIKDTDEAKVYQSLMDKTLTQDRLFFTLKAA